MVDRENVVTNRHSKSWYKISANEQLQCLIQQCREENVLGEANLLVRSFSSSSKVELECVAGNGLSRS